MHDPLNPDETRASGGLWAGSVVMTGFVAGHALQLQQAQLWAAWVYAALFAGTGSNFTQPGWKAGDKAGWEQHLKARQQYGQNEYTRTQ